MKLETLQEAKNIEAQIEIIKLHLSEINKRGVYPCYRFVGNDTNHSIACLSNEFLIETKNLIINELETTKFLLEEKLERL